MKHLILIMAMVPTLVFGQKEIKSIDGQATLFLNSEHTSRPFKKLLIISDVIKSDASKKITDQFSKAGIEAVTSLDLMPPVKEYSEDDIKQICTKHNIDGIVRIILTNRTSTNGVMTNTGSKMEFKVTVEDVEAGTNAATFVGRSFAPASNPEKGVLKFVKTIIEEIELIANGKV